MRSFISSILAIVALSASALAAETGYYSQPALYGNTLIFVSEGDLWTAALPDQIGADQPIIAHRLTSSEGDEGRPQISPDGKWLAFSAHYEGNVDVYVMPIDGGPPTRLTFQPGPDLAAGWAADGSSVLFVSSAVNALGRPELWRISPRGGMPERYPFGECSMISMSSTGKRFAFTRWSNENWTWKRYRGGTAPDVWLGELESGTFKPLTKDPASDLFPMWIGGRVYFLSDRSGLANIWSVSPDAGEGDLKQHTKFAPDAKNPTAIDGYDARWPAADLKKDTAGGAGRIVFCQAGGLALLDLKNDSVQRLPVQIASDRLAARRRFTPINQTVTEFDLSDDGKTLLIGSRGEILSTDVDTGQITQLTHDAASREWGATFLSKDKIALISDAGGEQQICAMPADGTAPPGRITTDREAWLFPPHTSPDGKYIAFGDKTLRLHILDVESMQRRQVDQSEAGEIKDYRFSPDNQWLAYTKPMPNGVSNVWLFNVRTGRTFAVSAAMNDDSQPRWDPKGKYLYMLSNRNLNPVLSQFDMEHVLINTSQVLAVPLASDTPPPDKVLAKAAKFDLEEWAKPPEDEDQGGDKNAREGGDAAKPGAKDAGKDGAAKSGAKKDDKKPPAKPAPANAAEDEKPAEPELIHLDTDGLTAREFILPIPPGNYDNLEALPGSVAFVANPIQGLADDTWPNPPEPKGTLTRFDIVKGKAAKLAPKVSEFAVSGDASAIAYAEMGEKGDPAAFHVISAMGPGGAGDASDGADGGAGGGAAGGGGDGEDGSKTIALGEDQQMRVDIPAEWKQILGEAWRLQRDFFWAPNMAGLDWPAMRQKYEALLPRIGTRNELNDLIGQLIGELGNSHTYIFGGQPMRELKDINVGMLGADIAFDGQGFRIARILPSQPWGGPFTSPLAEAHLNVKEGSYIRAINGMQLTAASNIYDLLQDQAGKMVRLTISDDAAGANTRTIEVKTTPNEQPLRYAAWVEANRKYVEDKSQGKIGYMHLPDMDAQGLIMFSRYFYPQYDKPALIIDIRDNGGGFVSQMIIERLARKVIGYDQPRQGMLERYPQRALNAHLAAIIDQHAGSDGDIFPNAFRRMGLGPLIGTRTWGGVVGIRGDKPFVDMGLSTQPEFAWWEKEGGWVIENRGVDPDIEVDITPADRVAGKDPQLDRAIEYLLKKLEEVPIETPKTPPWPVRMIGAK